MKYLNKKEEDSLYWLINCNKKSKFYGYILMYSDEFKIINHVKDFVKPNFIFHILKSY